MVLSVGEWCYTGENHRALSSLRPAGVRSRTFKLKNAQVFFRFALSVTLTGWVQARSRGGMEKPAASPRSYSCCSERSEPCPPTEPGDFPGSQPKTEALISISRPVTFTAALPHCQ